jgi:23S rRNA (cytosine1962-C5)-methyltransferase
MQTASLSPMSPVSGNYELLDFGQGRKLERFGQDAIDRPCPTAEGTAPGRPELWQHAVGRYERNPGGTMEWLFKNPRSEKAVTWRFRQQAPFRLELILQPLPSGQIGMFPEQIENWAWIYNQVRSAGKPLRILNLFAYTGGSTIAAAAAGGEVTHVDAARGIVERASLNAQASGLGGAAIRWIVDDALKFCTREVRRKSRYHALILDPPTYGHGAKGEVWRLKRDLPRLLQLCAELTGPALAFILLSCHTTDIDAAGLRQYLAHSPFGGRLARMDCGEMTLRTTDQREFHAGVFVRTTGP